MENCLLYDWLSVTLSEDGEWFNEYGESIADGHIFIELLGMTGVSWEIGSGTHGYSKRLWFEGVNIHLPSEEQHNVWLEMSGSGCRAFETYGHGDWQKVFDFALRWCNITRLDVSFDDKSGILDMEKLVGDTYFRREYVTKCNKHHVRMDMDDRTPDDNGITIYHGSRQSNLMVRIYDKAQQLKRYDEHWVRVEMELHRENARRFLELEGTIGEKWAGVLLNYVRYVDPDPVDSNRWRWPLKDYWSNLVKAAQPMKLYQAPGVVYNMERLEGYLFNQAGNSLRTYIECFGVDALIERLKETQPAVTPAKYKHLIQEWKRGEGSK